MKFRTLFIILVTLLILSLMQSATAQSFKGKKILFIDSYHKGYAWSDGTVAGVESVLGKTGVTLKIHRMDTKRNTDTAFKKQAAKKAKAVIDSFKPDVVIASDDNASKFLIVPYYKNARLPFVFCGVNWDASVYGFPFKNVTGMVEVSPVPELLDFLKGVAKGSRVAFLGPDILTARKNGENYEKVFGIKMNKYFAKNFSDYKKGFLKLQKEADMLLLTSDGGLYDKHTKEMNAFALKNSKIPVGAVDVFMAEKALVTFAKLAEEQGEWAAQTSLEILDGKSPSQIPIARNKKGKLIINAKFANSLGVELPYEMLELAEQVIE